MMRVHELMQAHMFAIQCGVAMGDHAPEILIEMERVLYALEGIDKKRKWPVYSMGHQESSSSAAEWKPVGYGVWRRSSSPDIPEVYTLFEWVNLIHRAM